MGQTLLALLLAGFGLLLLFLGLASSAGASCPAAVGGGLLDYSADVIDKTSGRQAPDLADVDILEVRSCLEAVDIVVELRVRGSVVSTDSHYSYAGAISDEGQLPLILRFSNGTAEAYEVGNPTKRNASAELVPSFIRIRTPAANFVDYTPPWNVTGEAGISEDGHLVNRWSDSADLKAQRSPVCDEDITFHPTPFDSPTVSVTSVHISELSGVFELNAKGTAKGDVSALRVSMGVTLTFMGTTALCFSPFGSTEVAPHDSTTISLTNLSAPSHEWEYSRTYTEADLQVLYGSLATVGPAKLEVRALGSDGSWGHANSSFDPLTETVRSRGDGSTFPLGGPVLAGGAGIVAAVFFWGYLVVRRKKRMARPPTDRESHVQGRK